MLTYEYPFTTRNTRFPAMILTTIAGEETQRLLAITIAARVA